MANSVRFLVEDSAYAVLVSYLVKNSRNAQINFNPLEGEDTRIVTVDAVPLKIVKRVNSNYIEMPGITLQFFDEVSVGQRTNPQLMQLSGAIHVCLAVSDDLPEVADRTMKKVQLLIDNAFYGSAFAIIDFEPVPALATGKAAWFPNKPRWRDVTNLQIDPMLHRTLDFGIQYYSDTLS
jgi:hypothetical protein